MGVCVYRLLFYAYIEDRNINNSTELTPIYVTSIYSRFLKFRFPVRHLPVAANVCPLFLCSDNF